MVKVPFFFIKGSIISYFMSLLRYVTSPFLPLKLHNVFYYPDCFSKR